MDEKFPAGADAGPILFFDGTCVLCDGFADLVLRRDHRRRFRLATLQGETAARWGVGQGEGGGGALAESSPGAAATASSSSSFPPSTPVFRTIVLSESGRMYRKSDAVLRVLPHLGGLYRLAPVLRAVPRVVRDAVYDLVARNRLRWFGTRACRVPTPGERARFLP